MGIEFELKLEIEKWRKKLKGELKNLRAKNKDGEIFIENIRAYFKDSHYFYSKEDLIKSFEALIWCWSWLEIGKSFGFLE